MSLYTSVYWTKRVMVVLALVLFVCAGIRIFQIVGTSLTQTNTQVADTPPELGFGKLNPVVLLPIKDAEAFKPTTFRISTTKGNLDTDNTYPLESTKSPLGNVYRITEKEITLATTEDPKRIAAKVGFSGNPDEVSSTERSWAQGGRELYIDGLYLLVNYKNNNLRQPRTESTSPISLTDQNILKTTFAAVLKEFDIQSDLNGYTYDGELVNYDVATKEFTGSGSLTTGQFLRINVRRGYPNLVKTDQKAQTKAAYPGFNESNNYVIIPTATAAGNKVLDNLVELGLYNWPLNQTIAATNPGVQTYPLKTVRQAYDELVSTNQTLVYAAESRTRKEISPSELSTVTLVDLLSVRVEMYEETFYSRFIQPVYVFVAEAEKGGKKYTLVYYVSALNKSALN